MEIEIMKPEEPVQRFAPERDNQALDDHINHLGAVRGLGYVDFIFDRLLD